MLALQFMVLGLLFILQLPLVHLAMLQLLLQTVDMNTATLELTTHLMDLFGEVSVLRGHCMEQSELSNSCVDQSELTCPVVEGDDDQHDGKGAREVGGTHQPGASADHYYLPITYWL